MSHSIDEQGKNLIDNCKNFNIESEDFDEKIEEKALELCKKSDPNTVNLLIDLVKYRLKSHLGILSKYIEDESINEIMVNGPGDIFLENSEGIYRASEKFQSRDELEEIIRQIAAKVHREINEMNPILDARLESGARVNAVYKNVAIEGPALTIRKFSQKRISMNDLISNGTLSAESAEFLKKVIKQGYNIFVSGGTSSGKTTFLNALTDYISDKERIVVIEDSRELMIEGIPNIVQMECHNANSVGKGLISMDMLIKTSLRMRPDRIIVGEIRGKEVADMLQAMNTGHSGMSTGHGNSIKGMLLRLEAMYLMGEHLPIDAIRAQITEGIDIMVHLVRTDEGKRKVVEIAELLGYENGEYKLRRLFVINKYGKLESTGAELSGSKELFKFTKTPDIN